MRRETRTIRVGDVMIGSGHPIPVQTMTKTDTRDVDSTIKQINEVEKAGCQIVRCAVPDEEAAKALERIVAGVNIPVIADIHFSYRLALDSIKSGVKALRINPGNIGSRKNIEKVVSAMKVEGIPIRIGVNSGSLEKDILRKHGSPTSDALVESAMRHVAILDELNFKDVKVSVKSTSVKIMQESYRKLAALTDIPLHLGVTEAGTFEVGSVKSAIGIGSLLSEGIGDTIRVSLTDDPIKEVILGNNILKSLGHFKNGIELISCPGCGRLEIDLQKLVKETEERIVNLKPKRSLKVAILGCVVNGPGEASDADIGIAGGRFGKGQIYKNGKLFKSCNESELVDILVEEIKNLN
ncbi:MAG: flavodoxin-dependent (E)-4-hydroxy-3-methylbut-2-enyl-diphosphate synthase [Thermodesulfobacteriota bacterium]|nr:flavodoxin-dependent (E)-4-hydroxy-3-methylbut-2-enyl-diphosphate synthase [Thermodesulfobacteriota bacterium]|tara:strand:+ start:1856 stop:2914 length:1059 start_codon:yes stop_codon:yes gene_type:complete